MRSDPKLQLSGASAHSTPMREFVLNGLHVVLAAFLLLMAFLTHGRVPGFSADESAVLGFLVVVYLGIPALLVGLGTLVWSVLTEGKRFVSLAVALIATGILVLINVWAGVFASVSYLSFGVWAFVERLRTPVSEPTRVPHHEAADAGETTKPDDRLGHS